MKNKLIKLCCSFLVATFMISPLTVFAATYPGDTFKVTLACGNIEGSIKFTASNATITGGTGNWCDRGKSYTISAKASAVGSATIKMVGVDATNVNDLSDYSGKTIASKTVTISKKSTGGSSGTSSGGSTTSKPVVNYSKDNNLKSLTISEGTLSPKFSASTTSYTVDLASTVTSIKIDAVANDSKAKVKGTGTKELEPGENIIEITVTAENGNPKVYTIKAIVDESPLVFLPYGDQQLGVVRNLKNLKALDGFEEKTVKVNDADTIAWYSSKRNVTLLYLQNGNDKDYYIYEDGKVTSIYKPLSIGKNLAIVNIPTELEERSGMKFGDITIQDVSLKGWTYEDAALSNYSLIYAMNEFGEYNYYQYESSENTLQLYPNMSFISQDEFDALVKENQTIKEEKDSMTMYFYIACGIAVVTSIFGIVGFVNANRYKKRLLTRNKFDESNN